MIKTKSLYLFALVCAFSLQLCAAQDDLGLDFPTLRNEEWNEECEFGNWENEECSWEEEQEYDEDEIFSVSSGKAEGCGKEYTIVQGDICDKIATANQISVQDLQNLNPGLACESLQIGQNICVAAGQPGGGGDNPPPAGDINVSFDQFSAAVTATNGYPAPTQDQYNSFINNYQKAEISTTRELAMFLSEIIWESGGLQFKEEIACKDTKCPDQYRTDGDDPNKFYYGRGYIQLTWSDNYRAASQDLFGDDRLVTDPDQVASNEDVAWQTAFWYWKANVHNAAGVQDGQFGSATNAINGALECNPCQGNCPKRNEIYAAVLPALGVNEQPNTAGC